MAQASGASSASTATVCSQSCADMITQFNDTVRDLRSAVMLRPHGAHPRAALPRHVRAIPRYALRCAADTDGALWLSQTRARIETMEAEARRADEELAARRASLAEAKVRWDRSFVLCATDLVLDECRRRSL